jgi:hypothetical protein
MMRSITFLILLLPAVSFGWGETGHRTVCQIAYDELTRVARVEVDRLIALDPDYDSFNESCLFADGPPRQRPEDHYLNVPRSFTAITTNSCPLADTCLFPAIENDTNSLADTSSSDADRLFALKLLGHWIGDIHQPMHVSFQDDLGANSVAQKGDDTNGNLHSAWDSDIIEQEIGSDFSQIAAELRTDISEQDRSQWSFDSPVEWANESFQVAISPAANYCTQKQGACWYGPDNMMLHQGEPQRDVAITDYYTATHSRTVELRLKQAGIRLGALLNRTLQ